MKSNTEKITPELIRQKRLVFYPTTTEESSEIQQKLIAMGASWAGLRQVRYLEASVAEGLTSVNGRLYYNPSEHPDSLLATVQQFDTSYFPVEAPRPQDKFNALAEKLDALAKRLEEVSAKVDKIHDEVFPTISATKPKLKPAGLGG